MTEKEITKKHIVFIAWKDINNPSAGGAEILHHELSKQMLADGYRVLHLVPGFKGCNPEDEIDGVKIIRIGQSILCFYWLAFYFIKNLKNQTDLLIDTFSWFTSFTWLFFDFQKSVFLIHHVNGIIWFWQTAFGNLPSWLLKMVSIFGFVIEKIQLLLTVFFLEGK